MSVNLNLDPLSDEEIENQAVAATEAINIPIMPVPGEALPLSYRHPALGIPVETWPYAANGGGLAGFMGVWINDNGGVERRPLTFCRSGGATGWRAEGFLAPYPLFNASSLAGFAEATVVIVNDERQAEATPILLPGHIGVCSPYELGLMAKTDWSALQGRSVIICPAAGDLASQFAALAADCAYRAGADTVRLLMLDSIGQIVLTPTGLSRRPVTPEGWGLEHAIRDGWTPEAFAEQIGPFNALPLAPKPLAFDSFGNVSVNRHGIRTP